MRPPCARARRFARKWSLLNQVQARWVYSIRSLGKFLGFFFKCIVCKRFQQFGRPNKRMMPLACLQLQHWNTTGTAGFQSSIQEAQHTKRRKCQTLRERFTNCFVEIWPRACFTIIRVIPVGINAAASTLPLLKLNEQPPYSKSVTFSRSRKCLLKTHFSAHGHQSALPCDC